MDLPRRRSLPDGRGLAVLGEPPGESLEGALPGVRKVGPSLMLGRDGHGFVSQERGVRGGRGIRKLWCSGRLWVWDGGIGGFVPRKRRSDEGGGAGREFVLKMGARGRWRPWDFVGQAGVRSVIRCRPLVFPGGREPGSFSQGAMKGPSFGKRVRSCAGARKEAMRHAAMLAVRFAGQPQMETDEHRCREGLSSSGCVRGSSFGNSRARDGAERRGLGGADGSGECVEMGMGWVVITPP